MAFHVVRLGSLIFPNYCLGRGLMDLAYNELMNIVHVQIGEYVRFDRLVCSNEKNGGIQLLIFSVANVVLGVIDFPF